MKKYKLGIIGYGNMANGIVKGILSSSILKNSDIIISDTDKTKLDTLKELGIESDTNNEYIIENSEILFLCVKPQTFRESIINYMKDNNNKLVVSIMAGISTEEMEKSFRHKNIARIMPNLPLMFGKGASGIYFKNYTEYNNLILNIFSSMGIAVEIDESLMDAVTSISGSGPAYVFYFINSLIKGGMKGGLTYEQAKKLAIGTVIGAADMVDKSNISIETLINNVCSKGGTTIEAINYFNENSLDEIIIKGVEKCRLRSVELGKI